MLKTLLLITFSFFSAALFASEKASNLDFAPYQATYSLKWRGILVGSSKHTVRKIRPKVFSAEAISKPILPFLPFKSYEKSLFTTFLPEIRPLHYEYQTQEKSKKREGEIYFDWSKKEFLNQKLNQSPLSSPLPDHALDKISLYFQLRKDLIQGKKDLDYKVIEPNKITHYHFTVVNEEILKTSLGPLQTIQLECLSHHQEKIIKLWLAKNHDYLIVKLQQIRHGKIIAESTIKTYSTQ